MGEPRGQEIRRIDLIADLIMNAPADCRASCESESGRWDTCAERYQRLEDALDARFLIGLADRSIASLDRLLTPAPPPSVHPLARTFYLSLSFSLFLGVSLSLSLLPFLGVFHGTFRWIEKQARCSMRVDTHPTGLIASTADPLETRLI